MIDDDEKTPRRTMDKETVNAARHYTTYYGAHQVEWILIFNQDFKKNNR